MAIIEKWYRTLRFLLNIFRLSKIDLNCRKAPKNSPCIPNCKEITYYGRANISRKRERFLTRKRHVPTTKKPRLPQFEANTEHLPHTVIINSVNRVLKCMHVRSYIMYIFLKNYKYFRIQYPHRKKIIFVDTSDCVVVKKVTSIIISRSSSSVKLTPRLLITNFSSLLDTNPLMSLSNTARI